MSTKKRTILSLAALAVAANTFAQQLDTVGIYGDKADSLEAAVTFTRQAGNYLPRGKEIRTEVISAAGLCKMACCNLAESFENSASVTVGYSDAVTGARQIRLLGLSGIYTQMLDENRPVMRGLSAPFGLSYVPGQWLESIQIAKGATSVINGVESMTGQINMEHRKPTDEKPLFVNLAVMGDTKTDFNIASSLQLNDSWSTVLLGHVSGNFVGMDSNGDGFLDDPMQLQFNVSNRWLYYAPSGLQLRFGIRAIRDARKGGMASMDGRMRAAYDKDEYDIFAGGSTGCWGSDILNRSINGYVKLGVPLNEDNSQNIAFVADYTLQDMDSYFGATSYLARQNTGFLNILYQNQSNEVHKFTLGLGTTLDHYNENGLRKVLGPLTLMPTTTALDAPSTNLAVAGAFGEYTFHPGEKFSTILGVRGEWYNKAGLRVSPRFTVRYSPIDEIVIRANAGRGLRYSMPLVDNIGVFSSSKTFNGSFMEHTLEDAWIFGGNMTCYLPFGVSSNTYLSLDYFHTLFAEQAIVDYEHGKGIIDFYNLSSLTGGRSFTDTFQADFNVEVFDGFTVTLTGRYTNAKQTLADRGLVEKPMTSRYKGVLNLQYATNLNKWIFDFTASVNGPCRVYDFMRELKDESGEYLYPNGTSPAYPLLYLQVTKRFKGLDVYIGGENLTNYRQKNVIFGSKDASGYRADLPDFDASCVWGPLMGIKVYAGLRFTLWKTE